ncbi:MAG: aldose epimerase family protein [Sarcina sp.]
MKIVENIIGKFKGIDVRKYTVDNEKGFSVSILNLGATITEINTLDKHGNSENIVLSYENEEVYFQNPSYYGATVGRTSGRIEGGKFTLNGEIYKLFKNYGVNSGHGGEIGFNKRIFEAQTKINEKSISVIFTRESKDMEEEYPGNLKVKIEYEIFEDNRILFKVNGKSDKDTLMNITNHSYFNLSGNYKRDILNHTLEMNTDKFLEIDEYGGVTGDIKEAIEEFDFNIEKEIGKDINKENPQLKLGYGYDHPFMFKDEGKVILKDNESGRKLTIKTDYPSVVVYTQNFIDSEKLKYEVKSKKRNGICLEVQNPPIGYKEKFKEHSILKKDEEYNKKTEYIFEVIN